MATVDADADAGEGRRTTIEKRPISIPDVPDGVIGPGKDEPSAFERLPDEIIQQILHATDSNGFASLVLLNRKWRSVAQQAHLYAHHLANCPSYAMGHRAPPQAAGDHDLPRLRRLFAKEAKRNLFAAYLRPSRTIIKVISNSISSSSCPGGEGIQLSPSPKGHHLLAYNSSRIYLVDARAPEIAVKREFKILRRPAATCVNDEGTMLAVLQTEMQVDIYNLTQTPPKRTQSIILDHSPRAIALSPCGSVLAAAYQGGIEVSSLNPGALATDRRAVKCDAVDALSFSFDGTQILGTTVHAPQPNTVILTAPYYDPGSHMADDNISALWTTSILFPNTSRDCSHAVLIQNGKYEEAAWAFTYDRSFETFRAVRIDDLRNGTTYFTGPVPSPESQAKLLPCTLPAASYYGELVSAGFQGKEIWLYGIPEDLDAVPDAATSPGADGGSNGGALSRRNSGPAMRSTARMQENSESVRVPQWQILCDKLRNTFVAGYKVDELEGVSTVKFVADFAGSCVKERLIVAARGVAPNTSVGDDEGIDFVDGGRITILDFDYGPRDGTVKEYTIEVGTKEPEVLEEEHRDIDTEVAIVRRRTVAQKRKSRGAAVMRSMTGASRPPPLPNQPSAPSENDEDDPLVPRLIGVPPTRRPEPSPAADEIDTQSIEEQEALDAPYAHASPRPATTLRRAATAAANNRRLHPSAAAGHIEYRRADGRAEHPHESDADNWVPPPPPYQKEDPCDLPSFLRYAAVLPLAASSTHPAQMDRQAIRNSSASMHQQPRRCQPANRYSSPVPPVPPLPSISGIPPVPPIPPLPQSVAGPPVPPVPSLPQAPSHAFGESSGAGNHEHTTRPSSRSSRYREGENIYDVSPPDSPALAPVGQHVSREQSESRTVSSPEPPSQTGMLPPGSAQAAEGESQTATASVSPEGIARPALSLQIPSQPGHTPSRAAAEEPPVRRLSASRTWPTQPMPTGSAPPAGYPYSAPPVNKTQAPPHAFPPPPNAKQLSGVSNRLSAPRPLSGSFQLPRIPVDNSMSGEPNFRRTSYQRPVSQQQNYSFPLHPPAPQFQQYSSRTTIHEPQPRRPRDLSSPVPPLPHEDTPLIISTPKGVTGAFDPPERHPSERRAETPILAPVPRHPRPATQPSILRGPAQERLDPIYSCNNNGPQQQQQQEATHHHHLAVPLASRPVSSTSSSRRRAPSLSLGLNLGRKQSRAERSAAKNVADAKRRGWSGGSKSIASRKKKKKDREREFDAASSAAWTDVTSYSVQPREVVGGNPGAGRREKGRERERRCVVM
ncbi:hypothetical protein VTK56DRAFT_4631 [Thermocarpiscus australiensis]